MKVTTASGSVYRIDDEDMTFVRLSEIPLRDAQTYEDVPAPCGITGKVIKPDWLKEGLPIVAECNCCGISMTSTRIVEVVDG